MTQIQRHIISKGFLPLDVEFNLWDMFADLRPKVTRYASIEEDDAALAELEECDHKASSERYADDEKRVSSSSNYIANVRTLGNGIKRNGSINGDAKGDSEGAWDGGADDAMTNNRA